MPESKRTVDVSRREFVAGLGAVWIAAACARDQAPPPKVAGAAMPNGMMESPAPPQQLLHFSAEQAKEVEAVASRIIPSDGSPGAKEAGVLYFIDNSLTTFAKAQVKIFDDGLVALGKSVETAHGAAAKFSAITPEQQDAILKSIEKTPFFGAMRFATISGFLSLPKYGGNKDYIGWKHVGQEHTFEHKPPFGWYDQPENQKALLGRVL